MPVYGYSCSGCGEFDSTERADYLTHDCGLAKCPGRAKRIWKLRINAESARHQGRWDPQVGAYVSSEREFNSLLSQGADREAAELGHDVNLVKVDSRDQEALAELHHQPLEERKELKAKAEHKRAKAKATQ